jgi:thioredoxin
MLNYVTTFGLHGTPRQIFTTIKEPSFNPHTTMATKQQFTNFQDLLSSVEGALLVDFYATWCGPCQMMAGILDEVSAELKDRVKIVKIDTDKYPELASQHQVYSLPTLVLFKAGQPVDRIEGVISAKQLVQRIQPHT